MSWLEKLLPPRIKRAGTPGGGKRTVPEGVWVKCSACDAVLYRADLETNLNVCPKCDHHMRIGARQRIDALLDPEGRFEIGQEVVPVDALKFKDSRKYPDRIQEAMDATGETDALVVVGGAIRALPHVVAAFEFEFMGGSMGSVVGERGPFVHEGVQASASDGWRVSSASSCAISSRMALRCTIMSIAPFSMRNSARWNPSGSFSRTVCSITRGPAKPISARGSAMTTSPRKQKLADTPPIVGSVSTEM